MSNRISQMNQSSFYQRPRAVNGKYVIKNYVYALLRDMGISNDFESSLIAMLEPVVEI